jgi:predicted DNA-binding protein YlxM (UPF0122 family)
MKLPTDIVSRDNKIRDSKICSLYATDSWTLREIGERFNISETRVNQIIYKNRHLLKIDKEYEKIKRVHVLKRLLKKHPENLGNKSTIDIVEKLRAEDEGDSSSSRSETKVIIIRETANANQNQSRDVSGHLSVVRV